MADPRSTDPLDAPKPPGGPQRADAPAGPDSPGEPAPDPGPAVQRVSAPGGPATVPDPTGTRSHQSDAEQDAQRENAATSLDEPSDGSGGE